ncbi:hypothetical protein ATANTOWER_010087 [Ataeniobius toweri]|uniref:Uncharacterized protein n=1 Tax=Ataeniobius toweri TaxID=208326 RepID=A0ABU7CFQ7_9TELE|nr:hypothetical protein [Ataeniobius toweri]
MAHSLGGWSQTLPATAETQEISSKVKQQVEEKTKKSYEEFCATEYRDNPSILPWPILIKVDVGGSEYLHLLVDLMYVGLRFPLMTMLRGVEEHHKKDDPLEPFMPNV